MSARSAQVRQARWPRAGLLAARSWAFACTLTTGEATRVLIRDSASKWNRHNQAEKESGGRRELVSGWSMLEREYTVGWGGSVWWALPMHRQSEVIDTLKKTLLAERRALEL